METVTITKAEYEDFLASKEHVAHLERQVEYLLEQRRLSRHRQFGAAIFTPTATMDITGCRNLSLWSVAGPICGENLMKP